MGSVFEPEVDQGHRRGGNRAVGEDALPLNTANIESSLKNARSCGLSHVRVIQSPDVPTHRLFCARRGRTCGTYVMADSPSMLRLWRTSLPTYISPVEML